MEAKELTFCLSEKPPKSSLNHRGERQVLWVHPCPTNAKLPTKDLKPFGMNCISTEIIHNKERVDLLVQLGKYMENDTPEWQQMKQKAAAANHEPKITDDKRRREELLDDILSVNDLF